MNKTIVRLFAAVFAFSINYAQSNISAVRSVNDSSSAVQPDEIMTDTLVISLNSGQQDWLIPDGGVYGVYFTNHNLDSPNAIVTKVEYKLRIDDTGDESNFRCSDYVIYLSTSGNTRIENDLNIYSQLGGDTDGGFDDDEADDSDIYLNWRSTDFFNGEKLNQYWGARIYDVQTGKSGEWNYLKLKIYYVVKPLGSLYTEVKNISGFNQSIPGPNGRVQLYDKDGNFVRESATLSYGQVYFDNIPAGDNYSIEVYHYPHDPITIFGAEYWGKLENIEIVPDKTTINNFERNQPFKLEIKVFKNGIDVTGGNLNINEELEIRVTVKNPSSEALDCGSQLVLDRDKEAPYDFNDRAFSVRVAGNSTEVFNFSFTPTKPGQYFSVVGTWTGYGFLGSSKKITDGDAWYNFPIINAVDPAKDIIPPLNPVPPDRASTVPVNITELSWDAATLNGKEVSTYDVYFGDVPKIDAGNFIAEINANHWNIDSSFLPLAYNQRYYWQINAKEEGKSALSEIWSFKTERNPSDIINKIKYDIYIWTPGASFLSSPFRIFTGEIDENTTILVPDINISNWFGSIADAFNTISGSSIQFGNIANEDIYLKIKFLFRNGGPRVFGGEKLFMEMWCEVFRLSDLQPYYGDYKFNEGEYVTFRLDKDQGLANYSNLISLNSDSLAYYYLIDSSFSDEGLETIDEEEFLTFKASHFSKFGGGRGQITSTTEVGSETKNYLPDNFLLEQNYPNPFNPATVIKFSIPSLAGGRSSFVNLTVYDILGRRAATLVNEYKTPGNYEVEFDGSNFASGIYFYKISAGNFTDIKKMVLLK